MKLYPFVFSDVHRWVTLMMNKLPIPNKIANNMLHPGVFDNPWASRTTTMAHAVQASIALKAVGINTCITRNFVGVSPGEMNHLKTKGPHSEETIS